MGVRFTFEAWGPTKEIGSPEVIAKCFSVIAENSRLSDNPSGIKDVKFEIVDVRQTPISESQRKNFIDIIQNILLKDQYYHLDIIQKINPNSRFLFVGNEDTLSEEENSDQSIYITSKPHQIKKDIELLIRALQHAHVAHYAGVHLKSDYLNFDQITQTYNSDFPFFTSAILNLWRHYAELSQTKINTIIQIQQLRDDVERIFKHARKLSSLEFLGVDDKLPEFERNIRNNTLLNQSRVLFQLGKRVPGGDGDPVNELKQIRDKGESTIEVDVFDPLKKYDFPDSSYELYVFIEKEMNEWAKHVHDYIGLRSLEDNPDFSDVTKHSLAVTVALYKLKRYEILRDIGRLIGSGAVRRIAASEKSAIVIIDDLFYDLLRNRSDSPEIDALRVALELVEWPLSAVHVVPTRYLRDGSTTFSASVLIEFYDLRVECLTLEVNPNASPPLPLEEYEVVIIDPEAKFDHLGAARIQGLSNYLRKIRGPSSGARWGFEDRQRKKIPRIIAFSMRESAGYVQQCLNFGADAFATKTRPFFLLFDLARVWLEKEYRRADTELTSQFRFMNSLKSHVIDKLQRASGPSYIYGGLYLDKDNVIDDYREAAWIKKLPKADLHFHIGTAISLDTITILALNTLGYWFIDKPRHHQPLDLISKVAKIATLSEALRANLSLPPIACLAAATAGILKIENLPDRPFGLGDTVIDAVAKPMDKCQSFEVCALIVAMLSRPSNSATEVPRYFQELSNIQRQDDVGGSVFDPMFGLLHAREQAQSALSRIACRWNGEHTRRTIWDIFGTKRVPLDFWQKLQTSFESRVSIAANTIDDARKHVMSSPLNLDYEHSWMRARQWLKQSRGIEVGDVPSQDELARGFERTSGLEDYVCIGEGADERDEQTGLQYYLQGSDFLGSAHLQYPENILIASYDIVKRNAQDNIIYSEVRCETTGYTNAGMGARDATDALRCGFDLASLYLAVPSNDVPPGLPLVRTNILLAAKRHKGKEEAERVVSLLYDYLENRSAIPDYGYSRQEFNQPFPNWWRPCDVVGFDISGDESKEPKWLSQVLKRLASRSSPITIHAGEAETADSIWRAVYDFYARRIGHGLRLAENIELQEYFVREGICVEFCPYSNRITNRFASRSDRNLENHPYPRYEYPLRQYMRMGVECTISTDNRFLHPENKRTLTSEYLEAARMVGGLTRWEVLQIVKAGFKNAFLAKGEIREMLNAVEEAIYKILSKD